MKRRIVKGIAVIMACFTLSLSVFASYSVPVKASAISISLPRCIDIILTKQGIVANQTSLSSIGDVLVDTLDTSFTGYVTYCKENGLDTHDWESYRLWKENTGVINALLDAIVKNRQKNNDDSPLTDTDVVDVLVEPNDGDNIVVPKSIQQPIVDAYKAWWEDCGGYYLVRIPSYKELTSYCYNSVTYDNLAYLCEQYDFVLVVRLASHSYHYNLEFRALNFGLKDCVLYNSKESAYYKTICGNFVFDWVMQEPTYKFHIKDSNGNLYADLYQVDLKECEFYLSNESLGTYFSVSESSVAGTANIYNGFVSKESTFLKVWKSLDAFKSYSVGAQNVYYSPTYSTTVSNDITMTNDYITTYANQYSYSSVQQEIDNSSEVTEEIVDSIVGSTITNITNNYYYTSPGGELDDTVSGSDSDDDGGGSSGLLGSLGSLFTK